MGCGDKRTGQDVHEKDTVHCPSCHKQIADRDSTKTLQGILNLLGTAHHHSAGRDKDKAPLIFRLRLLATHIEGGGDVPDVSKISLGWVNGWKNEGI